MLYYHLNVVFCAADERVATSAVGSLPINVMFWSFLHERFSRWILVSVVPLTAKPVRPGHYPPCSPTSPFFIRGYSHHPVASCKADFHNVNEQQAAAPAAPAAPEGEARLAEAHPDQVGAGRHLDSQNDDGQEGSVQDNM